MILSCITCLVVFNIYFYSMITIKNIKENETVIFAESFEHEAFEQVKKMINFEAYLDAKIRIMPDAHAGIGCTVGTTMTITDKITPNLVGVDIGCGMLTVKLKNNKINFSKLDEVISAKVPSGFNVHGKSKKDV
jgi:tRNA-splicing ligase RtcB (3'-phosphate/5'-hydroxy nucleic acid ligase)